MPLLYEPNKPADTFPVTPFYDQLMAAFAEADPDHPDPRFTKDDCHPFTFRWPANPARTRTEQ